MHELSEGRAKPILWVTHGMLSHSRDLSLYMDEAGGRICGLKIHGESENWNPAKMDKPLQRVFGIARERGLFVMVHTGEKNKQCDPRSFDGVCRTYGDVPVILAHGRPLASAVYMLTTYRNAYVDTSFMPHWQFCELVRIARERNFVDRILFGTDSPIPGRYLKSSLPRHLRGRMAKSQKIAGDDWRKISWENAKHLVPTIKD